MLVQGNGMFDCGGDVFGGAGMDNLIGITVWGAFIEETTARGFVGWVAFF